MRCVHRRRGGAVLHERQPAGIAGGHDVDGGVGAGIDLLDHLETVLADRRAHRDVLLSDRLGDVAGTSDPLTRVVDAEQIT